jgi:hypothetical protein
MHCHLIRGLEKPLCVNILFFMLNRIEYGRVTGISATEAVMPMSLDCRGPEFVKVA